MFPLSDKTRRRVGMAAFFLFGAVPTAIVLALGVARHLPGHVRHEEQRLSWLLGQSVSIERLEHPRPGRLRYEALEIFDPETGRPLLRCGGLDAAWHESAETGGAVWTLTASRAEIEGDDLVQVFALVERLIAGRAGRPEAVVLNAGQTRLRSPDAEHRLTGMQARIAWMPAGAQLDVAFRIAGVDTPKPVQIRVERRRESDRPVTRFGLATGEGEIPCSLVAMGLPSWNALGPECRFRGLFWMSDTADGGTGEMFGTFTGVDLARLAAGRLAHTIEGAAQIGLQKATFVRGRLDRAEGGLIAGPGRVSRLLLEAAVERLDIAPGLALVGADDPVAYQELALAFRLQPAGVQLWGNCQPKNSGTVLLGSYGVLLGRPAPEPIAIAALIDALVPAEGTRVPATRETDWLIRRLPLP